MTTGRILTEGGGGPLYGMGRVMGNFGIFLIFQKLRFCWLFICLFPQAFPCRIQKGCQSHAISPDVLWETRGSSGICHKTMC